LLPFKKTKMKNKITIKEMMDDFKRSFWIFKIYRFISKIFKLIFKENKSKGIKKE